MDKKAAESLRNFAIANNSTHTGRMIEATDTARPDVGIDCLAAKTLRYFALNNGEAAFARLVTAALAGEEWAIDRFVERFGDGRGCLGTAFQDKRTLKIIRNTDTTRPDGAIAREFEV